MSGSVSGHREVSEGRKGLRRELRTLSSQALETIMAPRRGLVLPQLHVKGHGLEGSGPSSAAALGWVSPGWQH